MSLFCNWHLQFSFNQINSKSFSTAIGFAILTPSNSYYYVSDHALNEIFILNESWSYLSSKTFSNPAYLITIGISLYATGESNIWKLDQNLITLIQYNSNGTPRYRGIYYNSRNNFIYVAPSDFTVIHVFYLDLTFRNDFSTSTYNPWSIAEYNNQMYVGTKNGIILVIVNENIFRLFNGCNGNSVVLTYIFFDEYSYMVTSCEDPINQLYLYYPNGTYLNKKSTTRNNPRYFGYDSKGHFIQISMHQTSIYN
jgi:hypothetical protein